MGVRIARGTLLAFTLLLITGSASAQTERTVADTTTERFSRLALDCIHREYPNKIGHLMTRDEDAAPPRDLHPMFYGCFDWHSAVHGHWLLVRILRLEAKGDLAKEIRSALDKSFTLENVVGELVYLSPDERKGYERPYGLAWFLAITAELREWDSRQAREWLDILKPMEGVIVRRMTEWLPKLSHPVRGGTHGQTAFSLGLMLDWARIAEHKEFEDLIVSRAMAFYAEDEDCPIGYEPSGEDFLSACLMEADLMRRVLKRKRFVKWLDAFLPVMSDKDMGWLVPAVVTDPTDGRLAHLDGLNLSRAWALEGIASILKKKDKRRQNLLALAEAHTVPGLASVTGEHYEGGHWLASFAIYLVTKRGINLK